VFVAVVRRDMPSCLLFSTADLSYELAT